MNNSFIKNLSLVYFFSFENFFSLVNFSYLWIFSLLWIFFIGGSFSFIKHYFVIHLFLKWIFIIKKTSSFNFNFFSFFFNIYECSIVSKWIAIHFKRNAIIISFKKSATVEEKSDDFFHELETLIFSFHVNDANFINNICYTIMKYCKNDVDAIALRCQISWLIILIEITLSYICITKYFLFIITTRRRHWPYVFIKFLIFEWCALKSI